MRRFLALALLLSFPALAQRPAKPNPNDRPLPPPMRCCATTVFDANGKAFGEVIKYNGDYLESLMMRYELSDGTSVALRVSSEYVLSTQGSGGSAVLFPTIDCSGPSAFVPIYHPEPMIRQAVVLPVGSPGQYQATGAWLFVSDPLATRTMPAAGTVFLAQWGDNGACVPYPPPGYTYMGGTFGGYWLKRVEDLYVKWKRPFYIK
ncbi:MAG TPA: hypothetical protein VF824_22410 [Thermoanaerobaculia bacterium]|jgi:hypothetical protein